MRSKLTISVIIVLAIAAVLAAAYLWQTKRTISLSVAEVEKNAAVRVFGLGTVEARVISKVGFEVGAALTELLADQGDRVRKGDVLARLHPAEQEAKVAMARASVKSAEAGLGKAGSALERAEVLLAQKQSTNRRQKELASRKVISDQVAEEAQRDEEVAAADAAVARSEVEVARMQHEGAVAQLQFEETLLEHHALTAPFDALVVARLQELGAVVRAGDPIFTLVAPETVWARAHVDESLAGMIEVGQPAEVRLRSLPQRVFKARVARIDIESDRVSEERRVYVKCEQCPSSFHLGEQAEVFITVANLDEALLVPENDVRSFDGTKGEVWTIENGRLARRVLAFRYRTEDSRLEVVGGLPDGAKVALGVPAAAREGRSVRAVAGGSP
ncbi:MAG: efflux RND transporter periplasmic adaptor subunit [Rhizobiales bacterium]|jgi:HlyD family secretion protein|nr:efflux RND transporter periplasmic adaptor subunit [Hyphomicrobiales bacterium]MBP9174881.1 efflux RND transporter periplasmic adaptor subunit [Hyphomicrobiales bacterium]